MISEKELNAPCFKQGDKVIVEHPETGLKTSGIVVGIAAIPAAVLGRTYIIEDTSGSYPNVHYPYSHYVSLEFKMENADV